MATVTHIIPPSRRRFADVAREVTASGLRLMTDGKTVIASPQRIPGWFVIPVRVREAA